MVNVWRDATVIFIVSYSRSIDFKSRPTTLVPKRIFIYFFYFALGPMGTAVTQWLRCCATNRKVAGSIPAGLIGNFHWGQLSLYQKWVPGTFPGGKGGRCVRLTNLPLSCAVVMKSGNLKFLEYSGPFQAYNGTALPLPHRDQQMHNPVRTGPARQ